MPLNSTILSIDTAAAHCAAALVSGDQVLASSVKPMTSGQAEVLFDSVDAVLAEAGKAPSDVTAIAVSVGPGNFTGIRIGTAAARGLSLSLGVPALGISVFDALIEGKSGRVLATVDARVGGIYAAMFDGGDCVFGPEPTKAADLPDDLNPDICAGFAAEEFAKQLGAQRHDEAYPGPEVFARVAMRETSGNTLRPKPFYLKSADAALPSQPPPVIVP